MASHHLAEQLPRSLPKASELYRIRKKQAKGEHIAGDEAAELAAKLIPGPVGIVTDVLVSVPSAVLLPVTVARTIKLRLHSDVKVPFHDIFYRAEDIFKTDRQMNESVDRWRKREKKELMGQIGRNMTRDIYGRRVASLVYPSAAAVRLAVASVSQQLPEAHAMIANLPIVGLGPVALNLGEILSQPLGAIAVETLAILGISEITAWANSGLRRANTDVLINKYNQIDPIADAHLNKYRFSLIEEGRRAGRIAQRQGGRLGRWLSGK